MVALFVLYVVGFFFINYSNHNHDMGLVKFVYVIW